MKFFAIGEVGLSSQEIAQNIAESYATDCNHTNLHIISADLNKVEGYLKSMQGDSYYKGKQYKIYEVSILVRE